MRKRATKKVAAGPVIVGEPEVVDRKVTAQGGPPRIEKGVTAEDEKGELKREAAFSFEPVWKGQGLEAFSIAREMLFLELRKANGARRLYDVILDRESFYPDAVRLLYLCLHTPADWRVYRGDLVAFQEELVDVWASQHLQSGADKLAVVVLGMQIWNASQEGVPEVVPPEATGRERGHDPGN